MWICQSLYKGHSLHEALIKVFLPNTYSCSTLFESLMQRGQPLYMQNKLSHAVSFTHRLELPPGYEVQSVG